MQNDPPWLKWALGVGGALFLIAVGALIGVLGMGGVRADRDEARARLAIVSKERDRAEAETRAIQVRRAEIIGEARSKRRHLSRELGGLRRQVGEATDELAETNSAVTEAHREELLSSIADGIWQAEVDFIPGTYRAPGGEGCYWALLDSADTSDIINNGGFGPNQTITIDSPWFETSDCGKWERID